MASTLLETNTQDLRALRGNGSHYRVPRFQRDYAWTQDHWAPYRTQVIDQISNNKND